LFDDTWEWEYIKEYFTHIHYFYLFFKLYMYCQLAVLNNAGWEDTVIWNPYGNSGMGYNNFVCVESVKVCFVLNESRKKETY